MAGSITLFITMSVAGRATTTVLNVFQVMEMRSVIGIVMLMPLVYLAGGLGGDADETPARRTSAATSRITPASSPGSTRSH